MQKHACLGLYGLGWAYMVQCVATSFFLLKSETTIHNLQLNKYRIFVQKVYLMFLISSLQVEI